MKIIGILMLLIGLGVGFVGIWRKKNTGGPIFIGGQVTDSIRDLYGVKKPSNTPIIIGAFIFIIGLVLIFT